MIKYLYKDLIKFKLWSHHPSSWYFCDSNIFVLDGTQKVTFKVCSFEKCFKSPASKSDVCQYHKIYKSKKQAIYTGGLFNMLCECGCPINITPFKDGESFLEMLYFAQKTLKVEK